MVYLTYFPLLVQTLNWNIFNAKILDLSLLAYFLTLAVALILSDGSALLWHINAITGN